MKKIFIGSFIFFSAVTFAPPAHAQVPFGGLEVFMMPCTCGFVYNYHVFAPLYLGAIPTTGAFSYPMAPTTYSYFLLHPGAWALGFFATGAQACWMWAGKFCYPLPNMGIISPFTGTSL